MVPKQKNHAVSTWFHLRRYIQCTTLVLLFIVGVFLLIIPIRRINVYVPINYNEGWNTYHTLEVMSGVSLSRIYQKDWTPFNYPPFSLYLISTISYFVHAPLFVGRYLSLLSLILIVLLVGYSVFLIQKNTYAALFSGLFCLILFLCIAMRYIGMNDPQLLGQVFLLGGLVIYLRKPITNIRLIIIGGLFTIALFTKHNIIALPIAFTWYLYYVSHKLFVKWILCFGGIFTITLGMLEVLSHGNFIESMLLKRTYSWSLLFHKAIFLPIILFTLILVLYAALHMVKQTTYKLVVLYLFLGLIIGILMLGGAGTDINMLFDLFIGFSLLIGCMIGYLEHKTGYIWILLLLTLNALLFIPYGLLEIRISHDLQHDELLMRKDAAFLAGYTGHTICETILLCFMAHKTYEYDPFLMYERVATHDIPEQEILKRLQTHYYSVIEIEQPIPSENIQNGTAKANERFTSTFYQALEKYYSLRRRINRRRFYVPKA